LIIFKFLSFTLEIHCNLGGAEVKLDMEALMSAKENSVKSLTGGIKMLFKSNKVGHLEGKLLMIIITKSIVTHKIF